MKRTTFVFLLFLLISFTYVYAHPGRTDANSGHYDHSTGEYHYHTGEYVGQNPDSYNEEDYLSGTLVDTSPPISSNEINKLKDRISTLEDQLQLKETIINNLMDEINENKDNTFNWDEFWGYSFILIIIVIPITYYVILVIKEKFENKKSKNWANLNRSSNGRR